MLSQAALRRSASILFSRDERCFTPSATPASPGDSGFSVIEEMLEGYDVDGHRPLMSEPCGVVLRATRKHGSAVHPPVLVSLKCVTAWLAAGDAVHIVEPQESYDMSVRSLTSPFRHTCMRVGVCGRRQAIKLLSLTKVAVGVVDGEASTLLLDSNHQRELAICQLLQARSESGHSSRHVIRILATGGAKEVLLHGCGSLGTYMFHQGSSVTGKN